MSDDDKKTVLQPRFANRMSYHTVVMTRPPPMESAPGAGTSHPAALDKDREAPRVLRPARFEIESPMREPRKSSSIADLRTRMVRVQAVPTFQNRPMQSQTMPARTAPIPRPSRPRVGRGLRKTETEGHNVRVGVVLVVALAAILAGIGLVLLPASEESRTSESAAVAETSSQVEEHRDLEIGMQDLSAGTTIKSEQASATRTQTRVTAAQAGQTLLAGRRARALELYRELAMSSSATPGIQAMAEVLAQKVTSP